MQRESHMDIFPGFAPPQRRLALRSGKLLAEIWPEAGGSVARFEYLAPDGASLPLFRGAGARRIYQPSDLACWPLLPYSNRIAHGKFIFEAREHRLAPASPESPHALHGVGWRSAWRTLAASQSSCSLGLEHAADEEWPFSFKATQSFTLDDDALTIVTTLTNHDGRLMPCGVGQHPYIVCPAGTRLFADVAAVWLTDATIPPTARVDLPAKWDLRRGCVLDDVFIDNCFEPLVGAARVEWPDGHALQIEGSDNLRFLIVYHPPDQNYVCVELVSHMPYAINRAASDLRGAGLTILRPGEALSSTHHFVHCPA